ASRGAATRADQADTGRTPPVCAIGPPRSDSRVLGAALVIPGGRPIFLGLLAIALVAIVRASVRRDRVLGRLVIAASVIYLAGALLMGAYLQSFRGRS